MTLLELIAIGVSLSMDAFSVSICKGLSIKENNFKNAIIISLFFGFFQAIMPLIGFCIATRFEKNLIRDGHIISFIILFIIGIKMIKEKDKENIFTNEFTLGIIFLLAIATSIDALAVGISIAFLDVSILYACSIIGIITLVISFIGFRIGNLFAEKYQKNAQIVGGITLVLIGLRILFN